MRKLVLGLAMVVTMLAMVGCGTSDKNEVVNGGGFTPSKPNTETVIETEKEEINLKMSVEEMKEYYDTEKYVGTPYSTVLEINGSTSRGLEVLQYSADGTRLWEYYIEPNEVLQMWKHYNAILCDNNTPDDLTDDVVVYIFTTPIE